MKSSAFTSHGQYSMQDTQRNIHTKFGSNWSSIKVVLEKIFEWNNIKYSKKKMSKKGQ